MSRPTNFTCDDCGGPMGLFSYGGEEPDPDHPGKWRPSTTCQLRCAAAVEQWKADMRAAEHAVNAKHRDHTRTVPAPWPLPKHGRRLQVVKS